MSKHGWLLWTVLPLLIAAGLWWLTQRPADPTNPAMNFVGNERVGTAPVARLSRPPTRAELASLQTQAENACRCTRRPGSAGERSRACWRAFEQAVNRFEHNDWTSACLPYSTTVVCFGDGMEACITRDYGGGACTSDEARTIDSIWAEARREGGPQADDRANRRVAEAIQSFIRGERVRVPRTSGGCMG